jgi:hypothetical protein
MQIFCASGARSERSERGHPSAKKVLVYDLYGLTDEEIAIVEEAVGD